MLHRFVFVLKVCACRPGGTVWSCAHPCFDVFLLCDYLLLVQVSGVVGFPRQNACSRCFYQVGVQRGAFLYQRAFEDTAWRTTDSICLCFLNELAWWHVFFSGQDARNTRCSRTNAVGAVVQRVSPPSVPHMVLESATYICWPRAICCHQLRFVTIYRFRCC